MQEIQAALETHRQEVERLKAQLRSITDPLQALDLQRELEAVRVAEELEIIRIQLRYAREAGRDEAVAELENAEHHLAALAETRESRRERSADADRPQ